MTAPISANTDIRSLIALGASALLAASLAACGTSRKEQLHALARDWFETIRAEQVIPILPLTADLQPGDVFLVQTPIDRQQDAWVKGDYLPLDNHIHRFDPDNYTRFYKNSFFDDDASPTLPREWMRPAPGNSAWANAPRAAFPTFTFETSRGGGFNSMLPIQAVPVGLNLLGTSQASGTIVIEDARTYGVDMVSLNNQLKTWASGNRAVLSSLGGEPGEPPRNYLRVVSRVYLAGKIAVTIQDARSYAGGADVGAARPVELLFPDTLPTAAQHGGTPEDRVNELREGIKAMNRMLGAEPETVVIDGVSTLLPGASVRVTTASARTVGMSQTFDPPLVLGYLGFDVPILEGGELGHWIPTHSLLRGTVNVASGSIGSVLVGPIGDRAALLDEINARTDSETIYTRAAELLGNDWKRMYAQLKRPRSSSPGDLFADLALGYDNADGASKDDRRRRVNTAMRTALTEALNSDG